MADELLEQAVVEIEAHVQAGGWDRPPMLFALVRADRFLADDPETASRLGLDQVDPESLAPIEQEELPEQPLDEVLGSIGWPDAVAGCAIAQEIVILPPEAEAELSGEDSAGDTAAGDTAAERAAAHPERREARLVVGVLRDGSSSALLRLRSSGGGGADAEDDAGAGAGEGDELLTGPNLAPNLVEALLSTLS